MGGCAVALQRELFWQNTLIFKDRIDEDHKALNGMVCCGANDSRTEYGMAAPFSVDQPIAVFHVNSAHVAQQLVRPITICRGNMSETELMPTVAIHRNTQVDLWEHAGCLRPVCSITLRLCNLDFGDVLQ